MTLRIRSLLLACFACTALAAEPATRPSALAVPPDEGGAKAALNASPRHGEWIDVPLAGKPAVRTWVVYPEVKDKAPIVILIHEIFGESDWVRSTADALAAEGFIAMAPDLLSGMGPGGGGTDAFAGRDEVVGGVRKLAVPDVVAKLNAVMEVGRALPSATKKVGVVGFCWGGGMVFTYAEHHPHLDAGVAYYGTNPSNAADVEKINCPLQGHFGGNDNRVTATVATGEALMKRAGKPYEPHIYDGAGHGFLRQQTGMNGANQKAAEQAWPATIEFLHKNLK